MTVDWKTVALGEAGVWVSGGTPATSTDAYWGGEIPWMSSKSLTDFRVRDSDRRLTRLGAGNGTKLVSKDTILMVVRGMSLKSEFRMGITQREVALSQDLKGLVPRSDLDPNFLAYALQSRTETVLDMVDEAGHGTGRLQTDRLFALELPLPPHGVQRAIAATLGALDDKIELNRQAIVLIADLIDTTSERYGVDLPVVPLRDITTSVKHAVNPAQLGETVVDHFSLPAFDSGARPERVAASTIKSNKLRVPEEAILLSRLNPRFDRTWWASTAAGVSALASTEYLVLTADSDVELAVVWLSVRNPFFREELPKRVTGTSGSHQRVRPDDVLAIQVPDFRKVLPGPKRSMLALLKRAESLRTEADRLSDLRDALLPELLSGRMRASVQ